MRTNLGDGHAEGERRVSSRARLTDFPDLSQAYHSAVADLHELKLEIEGRLGSSSTREAPAGGKKGGKGAKAISSLVEAVRRGTSVEEALFEIDIARLEAALAELRALGRPPASLERHNCGAPANETHRKGVSDTESASNGAPISSRPTRQPSSFTCPSCGIELQAELVRKLTTIRCECGELFSVRCARNLCNSCE